MKTEEKANAYDELLVKAKQIYNKENDVLIMHTIEDLFPEVKEPEDERIRQKVIKLVKMSNAVGGFALHKWEADEMLAWLEKQGEQEEPQVYETEDGEVITYSESEGYKVIEPKFHEGDLVVDNCDYVWKIEGILNQFYILEGIEGGESRPTIEWVDKTFHLWGVQDARDGDVLACNEEILLFKSYSVQGRISLYCWYNGQTNNFHGKGVDDTLLTTRNKIYPATKEQRDILMKAMTDAGYTFDFEKKELKKIEQKTEENKGNIGGISPNWSEDDETKRSALISLVKEIKNQPLKRPEDWDGYINWLQLLKGRVQPRQEWSEEDKYMYDILCGTIENTDINENTKYTLISWLKSLKDRVQPKQEWSRDDEQYLLVCKNALAKYQTTDKWDAGIISRWLEDKLKSLRQRKGE